MISVDAAAFEATAVAHKMFMFLLGECEQLLAKGGRVCGTGVGRVGGLEFQRGTYEVANLGEHVCTVVETSLTELIQQG